MFRRKDVKIFSVPDWSDTTTKTYDLSTVAGREQVPINLDEIKDICFIYVRDNNEYYRLISDTTNGTTRTLVFDGSKTITITKTSTAMIVEFSSIDSSSIQDSSVTSAKLATNSVTSDKIQNGAVTLNKLANGIIDYVTPQLYGAVGDNETDDLNAFQNALASNKVVLVPDGTYYLSGTLKIPHNGALIGSNKFRTILRFADDVNGIQIDHSTSVSSVTISISGNSAGIYMYVPDNYSYNMGTICNDIIINRRSDTKNGDGILLVAKNGERISGCYNITFRDIDIKGAIKNGVHLTAKVTTNNKSETWITDVLFENIFIQKSETAILSDWEDISENDSVPQTGEASGFGNIKFVCFSAQYNANFSERFCKIMNITNCVFDNCRPFDYYTLINSNKPVYVLNATPGMCSIDMGFLPEIANVVKYINFENSTTFEENLRSVVKFLGTSGHYFRSIGNFYSYVETRSGTDAMTLSAENASFIGTPTLTICGDSATITAAISLQGLESGNNTIGQIKASPIFTSYALGFYGSSGTTGELIKLYINTTGNVTAVASSTIATSATLWFTFTYIRKKSYS